MSLVKPLRVLQVGLGPIGQSAARSVLTRRDLTLAAAADIAPALAGKDLEEVLGGGAGAGLRIDGDLAACVARVKPDVALHTTGSRLAAVAEQFETLLEGGAHVVSTTEELSWPWRRNGALARRLDAAARAAGRTLLGTGVNPGFAMDTLPLTLTSVCRRVDRVTVRRVVDAASRRLPLQKKIGAGLEAPEFRRLAAAGMLGHVGLVESLDLLAACLGFGALEIEERIEPVLATVEFESGGARFPAGRVAGLHHTARGTAPGKERISLDLSMYVGAPDPADEITIEGDPPITSRIAGGIAGDAATVAILVNAARRAAEAPAGLRTMAEIPPAFWPGA